MNPFNNIRTKVTEFKAERAARRANRANARREEEAQADADHPVFNGDTRPLRVQETTSKRSALAIAGILIAILVVISLIVGNVSLRNDYNALVSASETTKKDLSVEANALKQKAADTEKLVAEKDAANKALQDQLNAAQQMGPANPVAPPVVNPNTRSDAQQMVDQFGYTQDKGWTTDITAKAWADYANNHPGDFVMGASFAKTPEEAAAAAVNNPSIAGTRAQKENPFNWVLVYNPACMEYDAMAFQKAADGTFDWDSGFRECGVMIWVNVASGGQFRLLCDNGLKAPPVPTNKPASFPEVTPNVKLMPPVVPPVKTIVRNPPVDVCPDKPGNQPEGTVCNPPVDVCPDKPGNQPEGTVC
ncbi:MAG: hypothetical protein JWO55_751, partial [Candidatus Saccharibacteria bacterium]|nr:hypothetical protein [Candidatus Saccharibacteria bacterium]